jgi:hypothetical protein
MLAAPMLFTMLLHRFVPAVGEKALCQSSFHLILMFILNCVVPSPLCSFICLPRYIRCSGNRTSYCCIQNTLRILGAEYPRQRVPGRDATEESRDEYSTADIDIDCTPNPSTGYRNSIFTHNNCGCIRSAARSSDLGHCLYLIAQIRCTIVKSTF